MADHARGDFLSKRGTQVITDSLTYTGTGGVDVDSAAIKSGTTEILNGTGLTNVELGDSVDGNRVAIPFKVAAITAGDTGADLGEAGLCGSATITDWVAPKAGSVIAISLNGNTDVETGHVSAIAVVGATDTALIAELNTTDAAAATATAAKDANAFAAGKALSVKIMLGNTNSTANHVVGSLVIEM